MGSAPSHDSRARSAANNLFHMQYMSIDGLLSAGDAYEEAFYRVGAKTGVLVVNGKARFQVIAPISSIQDISVMQGAGPWLTT